MCGNFVPVACLKSALTKATVVIFEQDVFRYVCHSVCIARLASFFEFQPAMHAQREA